MSSAKRRPSAFENRAETIMMKQSDIEKISPDSSISGIKLQMRSSPKDFSKNKNKSALATVTPFNNKTTKVGSRAFESKI